MDLPSSTAHAEQLPLDALPDSSSSSSHSSPNSLKHTRFILISPERTLSSSGIERSSYPRKKFGAKTRKESADFSDERLDTNAWSEEEEKDEEDEEGEEEDGGSVSSSHQRMMLKESSSSISSCSTSTSEDSGVGSLSNSMMAASYPNRPLSLAHRNGMSQPSMVTSSQSDRKRFSMKVVREGLSSPDVYGRQAKTKEKSHEGFFTMRPKTKRSKPKQPPGMKASRAFSRKSKKAYSLEAPEITGPSPMPIIIQHEEGEAKSLNRQIAVRGKKNKAHGGHDLAQATIPETSYPLEVTTVNMEFKGVKCEVGCRGECWWNTYCEYHGCHNGKVGGCMQVGLCLRCRSECWWNTYCCYCGCQMGRWVDACRWVILRCIGECWWNAYVLPLVLSVREMGVVQSLWSPQICQLSFLRNSLCVFKLQF